MVKRKGVESLMDEWKMDMWGNGNILVPKPFTVSPWMLFSRALFMIKYFYSKVC